MRKKSYKFVSATSLSSFLQWKICCKDSPGSAPGAGHSDRRRGDKLKSFYQFKANLNNS